MRVISRKRLRDFGADHADAAEPLDRWYRIAKRAAWANFAEIRADFGSADQVGAFTVFNIAGNKFRLLAQIFHGHQVLLIGGGTPIKTMKTSICEEAKMATEAQLAGASPASDPYLDLVRAFPLRPIRSEGDHERAIAAIDALADRRDEWGADEDDYFVVLALLIERYEGEIYGEGSGAASPADAGAGS